MQCISFGYLDFPRVPIRCKTTAGNDYTSWVPFGMPRINDDMIDCCFFLYGSREDAQAGINPRGTGFLVAHETYQSPQIFAVTNWHVAVSGGASVIRINRNDGGVDIFEFGPDQWKFIPRKHDVAVIRIEINLHDHKVSFVATSHFASKPDRLYPYKELFVGDDLFMLGLFVDHQARTKNIPAARFGNISMLTDKDALIKQETGYRSPCFVADMHSRTGFSGSPVFAYRTFGSDLGSNEHRFHGADLKLQISDYGQYSRGLEISGGSLRINNFFRLIGIQCSQFPEKWSHVKVKGTKSKKETFTPEPPETDYIEGFSGMTVVIPAWDIMEVLQMLITKNQQIEPKPEFDPSPRAEAVPHATGENPTHLEDFNHLLGAASQKPKQAD